MRNAVLLLGLWVALGAAPRAFGQAPNAPAFVVIVHPKNPVEKVPRKFVADVFLKKVRYWRPGEVIMPTDLNPESPVRAAFAERLLSRSVSAVRNYWQQLIFSGQDLPPPEFERDEQVVNYIQKNIGGIGYVSGRANLTGVKVLVVE